MSITLIDKDIGNFHNMIFYHTHLRNEIDVLYQMMRISFNYQSWSEYDISKMRNTHLWGDPTIIKRIENYHDAVANIEDLHEGLYNLNEVRGDVEIKKKKQKKTKKIEYLGEITDDMIDVEVESVKINKKNCENKWKQIEEDYKDFCEKALTGNSDPRHDSHMEEGFIKNLSLGKDKSSKPSLKKDIKNTIDNLSWHSMFAIVSNKYKYAKLYVGYDSLDNNENYTVYMRLLTLDNNETVNKCVTNYSK